jgi:hypothetical protein
VLAQVSPIGPGRLPGLIISAAIALLWAASWWRVFEAAGQHGWAALIPFYNLYTEAKVAVPDGERKIHFGRSDKHGAGPGLVLFAEVLFGPVGYLCIRPFVGIEVAKKFGKTTSFGLGLGWLPFVFYPILAWGRATPDGVRRLARTDDRVPVGATERADPTGAERPALPAVERAGQSNSAASGRPQGGGAVLVHPGTEAGRPKRRRLTYTHRLGSQVATSEGDLVRVVSVDGNPGQEASDNGGTLDTDVGPTRVCVTAEFTPARSDDGAGLVAAAFALELASGEEIAPLQQDDGPAEQGGFGETARAPALTRGDLWFSVPRDKTVRFVTYDADFASREEIDDYTADVIVWGVPRACEVEPFPRATEASGDADSPFVLGPNGTQVPGEGFDLVITALGRKRRAVARVIAEESSRPVPEVLDALGSLPALVLDGVSHAAAEGVRAALSRLHATAEIRAHETVADPFADLMPEGLDESPPQEARTARRRLTHQMGSEVVLEGDVVRVISVAENPHWASSSPAAARPEIGSALVYVTVEFTPEDIDDDVGLFAAEIGLEMESGEKVAPIDEAHGPTELQGRFGEVARAGETLRGQIWFQVPVGSEVRFVTYELEGPSGERNAEVLADIVAWRVPAAAARAPAPVPDNGWRKDEFFAGERSGR